MQRDKYEIIESYAACGKSFVKPMFLLPREIRELKKNGFKVVTRVAPMNEERRVECHVSWENPKGRKASIMLATTIRALKRRLPDDLKSSL